MIHKLTPVYKDYLWGGTKLKTDYGKVTKLAIVAESWELDISDGPFPILVKLLDAKEDLSVQVHPPDNYAFSVERQRGKTEMWVVLEAEPDASLIIGFQREVSRAEVETAIRKNHLQELFRHIPVYGGECFFIPAGTVHAIGAGCVIAEVQENSDLTYRIYDYERLDASGNPRALHIEKALDVMDFGVYPDFALNESNQIVTRSDHACREILLSRCAYFTVIRAETFGGMISDFETTPGGYEMLLFIDTPPGGVVVCDMIAHKGDSFLLPQGGVFRVSPGAVFLRIRGGCET